MGMIEFDRVRVTAGGLVSRKDVARTLGKSTKTLCEWGSKGIGPRAIKVGGRIFYEWTDVLAFAGGKDRKSTRLNSSHLKLSRMPSSA